MANYLQTFDYIIVGGGTSGLVVASRLSEDPSIQVLIIEAGSNRSDDPRITVPGLAMTTYGDPDFDWCFESTAQSHLGGRHVVQPRGRILGGSSAINLGMVIFPSKADIDNWEKLGNKGWNWETIVPYLRKFHTLTKPTEAVRRKLALEHLDDVPQGTNGPLQISFAEDGYYAFNEAWPKTFQTMGYKLTGDPLSGTSVGAFSNPATIDPVTKTRSHSGSAYYTDEIAARPNLHVLYETLVERIIFTGNLPHRFASGVEISSVPGHIFARKEIILAAGAFKSPQLLELSGIGDRRELELCDIDVLVDSPGVGENLQDHGYVPHSWQVKDGEISGDCLREPAFAEAAKSDYENHRSGPLSVNSIASSFMPLVDISPLERRELIDNHIKAYVPPSARDESLSLSLLDHPLDSPSRYQQQELIRKILKNPSEASGQYTMAPFQIVPNAGPSLQGIFGMSMPGNYVSIISALNYPLSRGSVHISTKNPAHPPRINPRYMSHPLDLELHAHHVLWMQKIADAQPFASLLKSGGHRIHETANNLSAAKQIVKETFHSHYHPVGTCAMMPKALNGVVDTNLVVYGTSNLRVVDGGVIPLIPRGNIQAIVYAVAERAADIIKASQIQKSGHIRSVSF